MARPPAHPPAARHRAASTHAHPPPPPPPHVPSSSSYPLIIQDCVEEAPSTVDGVAVPVDTSRPNPNGLEFDNLYLVREGEGERGRETEKKKRMENYSQASSTPF